MTVSVSAGSACGSDGITREHGLPGHDLPAVESSPEELFDVFTRDVLVTELFAHVELPSQHLLVCETAGRTRSVSTG